MADRTLLARRRDNGAYDLFRERDPEPDPPVATALSRRAVFDHVAFGRHDRVVVEDGTKRTYLVVPFDVPTADDRTAAGGACIALRPEAGLSEAYLRGWVHAMKEALGDAIDRGLLTDREAGVYLEERVRAFGETTEVVVP